MKCLLIVPHNNIVNQDKLSSYGWEQMWEFRSRKRLWSTPSLSLLTVAGMLPREFSIEYIDLNYRDQIKGKYDLAFFSPSTSQVLEAYDLADKLKNEGTKVIMGGPHVTFMKEEALEHCDAVFIGESEDVFPDFIEDLKKGMLKRVYETRGPVDLSKCAVPRYDLVKDFPYKSIPIQTSRGCPHQCEFCVSSKVYGKKYRRKSFEQVKKEIEAVFEIWPRPFIFFTDDNMFMDSEYSNRLFDYLDKTPARWYAFSDARIADEPELLKKMAKAGCSQLLIGFESLSQENLAQINKSKWKHNRLAEYKNIINRIQSFGIGVVGSFVIGLDADTYEVFQQIYDFVESTNLYATNLTVVTPFVGTELYRKMEEEKRIITYDWSRFNGFELTFKAKNINSDEFEEGLRWLYKKLDSPERITRVLEYFKEKIVKRNLTAQ